MRRLSEEKVTRYVIYNHTANDWRTDEEPCQWCNIDEDNRIKETHILVGGDFIGIKFEWKHMSFDFKNVYLVLKIYLALIEY